MCLAEQSLALAVFPRREPFLESRKFITVLLWMSFFPKDLMLNSMLISLKVFSGLNTS